MPEAWHGCDPRAVGLRGNPGIIPRMPTAAADLLTAGKIAQELDVPPARVKAAITAIKLKPAAKKGACTYYGRADLPKIKKALK